MPKDLLIHRKGGEIEVAIVENGVLVRFWREAGAGAAPRIGDVVLGRVTQVVPGINAAFVDIGAPRAAFLAARDAVPRREENAGNPRIGECVHEGEAISVQIVKEPLGEKGARVSRRIFFAGRLLVLVPEGAEISVSRRIEDKDERARLAAIVSGLAEQGAGYIVRTGAEGASEAELRADATQLIHASREALRKRAAASAPETLHRELSPALRILRDETAGVDHIVLDDGEAVASARAYAGRAAPHLADKIAHHAGSAPLFESFGIAGEIAALGLGRVPLASGAWITIEETEALTAIDVNSGKYRAAGGQDAMALAVNREAAAAIGRQIVLRGLGGLIVIDFIDMIPAEKLGSVTQVLRGELAKDKAPVQIAMVPEFGLVALTRKRVRNSAARTAERVDDDDG